MLYIKSICRLLVMTLVFTLASLQSGCDIIRTSMVTPDNRGDGVIALGEAYGSQWEESVASWSQSYLHVGSTDGGLTVKEVDHLVNKELGIDADLADIVVFPMRDGSYKPIGKWKWQHGTSRYSMDVLIEAKNNELVITLEPRKEFATGGFTPPTDCGYLSGTNEIMYIKNFWDIPDHYYGKYDVKTRRFYMTKTDPLARYVPRAEWEHKWYSDKPATAEEKEDFKYEARFLGDEHGTLPLVCNEADYQKAKTEYKEILDTSFAVSRQKAFDKLAPHEKATLKEELCQSIGMFPSFRNCKQWVDPKRNPTLWERFEWNRHRVPPVIVPEH